MGEKISFIDLFGVELELEDEYAREQLSGEAAARAEDVAVLSARMDQFTALPDGSTAGDAELTDIRVGVDGVTYANAGDAVRGQINDVNKDLEVVKDLRTGVKFNNYATAQTDFLNGEHSALYIEFIMPETITERQHLYQGHPTQDATQIYISTTFDIWYTIKGGTTTVLTPTLTPGGRYTVGICADGRAHCNKNSKTAPVGNVADTTPMIGARRTTGTYKFTGLYCRIWGVADASGDTFMNVLNDPTAADFVYNVSDISGTQWASNPDNSNPFSITGSYTFKHKNLDAEIVELNEQSKATLSLSDAFKIEKCYVSNTGTVTPHQGWSAYCFKNDDCIKTINDALLGTNGTSIYAIAYYSSYDITPETVLGGVFPTSITSYNYQDIEVPECKMLVLFNRDGTIAEPQASITADRLKTIENDIDFIKNELSTINKASAKNIKAIYKNLHNANDFTFVGDELWCAENIYQDGVATEFTTVYRYKLTDNGLVLLGTIDTDFGHWNVVDYSPDNDCLLFTNAANEATTEGNWFAVVPHPSELGTVARLADCGIKYYVDVGFKVQAVWGDNNLGENNIVYLFSNNSQTITKVMLTKDNDGAFDGNFVTLETATQDTVVGVGGGDFWGDTLIIGWGVRYRLALMSMTDYSIKEIEKKFYYADGTPYNGSTQGVHIDDKYLWVFINVAGQSNNFLIQYYR